MCEVVVLGRWTMSLFIRQWGPGACGEDNWVSVSSLVAWVQWDRLPSPGGRGGAFIQVSLCLSSNRALVRTPVLLRWVSVFPGKTLFSEATEPLCVADVR